MPLTYYPDVKTTPIETFEVPEYLKGEVTHIEGNAAEFIPGKPFYLVYLYQPNGDCIMGEGYTVDIANKDAAYFLHL